MIRWARNLPGKRQNGQSLVEVALFLPIFLFIIAGIVEVSNLLNTQNKIQTSARIAAGYGAANYNPDDWAGTADAMGNVALNTVTETLEIDQNLWDLWSVRAKVNDTGDDFDVFSATHVFGNDSVVSAAEWTTIEAQVKADMLAELQSTGIDTAIGLEVVASVPFYNTDTILGLPIWQWVGAQRQRGLTVMRVGSREPYTGCFILPIAVKLDQYSSYPSNWWIDEGLGIKGPQLNPQYPLDPRALFPDGIGPQAWQHPNPEPSYTTMVTVTNNAAESFAPSSFESNEPGIPLWTCKNSKNPCSSNIYWSREAGSAGNFGWLSWDGSMAASDLRDSVDPTTGGNFLELYPDSNADEGLLDLSPYTASSGDGDDSLEPDEVMEAAAPFDPQGEWVQGFTGNVASAESEISWYVDKGGSGGNQPITIIVYDTVNDETGSNTNYHVVGFVTVNLLGYSFQGSNSDKWIVFEFLHWGAQCETDDGG